MADEKSYEILDEGNQMVVQLRQRYPSELRNVLPEQIVVLQIEDPEPLDELEAIAALEGYDVLFFGPGDFSHGIGAPGDFSHPRLVDARKRLAEAALRHGKFAGTTTPIDGVGEMLALGYRFLSVGADVLGLSQYCRALVENWGKAIRKEKKV